MFQTASQPLQQELTDIAFAEIGKVVAARNPPAHPAARYTRSWSLDNSTRSIRQIAASRRSRFPRRRKR